MKATEIECAHARTLLVGDFGAGKTYFIGLLHNYLKSKGSRGVYMFDFDMGFNTLKAAGFDVELDFYVGEGAFERFLMKMTELENDLQGFGGIAIDSLTTMQKMAMKFVHKVNPSKRFLGFVSSQLDYGVLIDVLGQLFPQLLNISQRAEVILTAHVREFQSKLTGEVKSLPAVAGTQLPSQVGVYFNEVWRMFGELAQDNKVKHLAQTATADRFPCKTQIPEMPFIIEVKDIIPLMIQAYGTGNISSEETAQDKMMHDLEHEGKVDINELDENAKKFVEGIVQGA